MRQGEDVDPQCQLKEMEGAPECIEKGSCGIHEKIGGPTPAARLEVASAVRTLADIQEVSGQCG